MSHPRHYGPASIEPPLQRYANDSMTDSGLHRMAVGTMVRLHWAKDGFADVGLLAIRGVSTWADLAQKIAHGVAIEVMTPRRRIFCGGLIVWAEVLDDPLEPERPAPRNERL